MKNREQHFYASSIATWMVDSDLGELIRRMKTETFDFFVCMVPTYLEAPYNIYHYLPQIEGTEVICVYQLEMKGKKKTWTCLGPIITD